MRRSRPRLHPGLFRPDIAGLRGVAVLCVVLYHAGVPHLGGGYVGVDVFFVISGFLITQLLWREVDTTERVALADFWARRVRRLLPAAALVLIATVAAAPLFLPPLRLDAVARDAVAAAFYSANYRFAAQGTDYLANAAPSPLQHFWSLGVEEQFYLLYPVLLVLTVAALRGRRLSRRGVAVGLAVAGASSFALCLYLTQTDRPWAFYSLPPRAWELCVGGALALAVPVLQRLPRPVTTALGWTGGAALLAAVLGFGPTTVFPGMAALLPVLGAAAVLAAGTAGPTGTVAWRYGVGRALADRRLQAIGAMSYSWYLWHWPVLVLGAARWSGAGVRLVFVLVSAGLAAGTLRLVENPARRAVRLVSSPRRSLLTGAALTATAVTVVTAVAVSQPGPAGSAPAAFTPLLRTAGTARPGAPQSYWAAQLADAEQPVTVAAATAVAVHSVPANLTPSLSRAATDKATPFLDGCDLSFTASVSPTCAYGDLAGRARIVTFGDSHAAQWFPGLDAAARQQHWRLENLTKATCPPFSIRIDSPALGREFRECEQWRARTVQRILAEKPALVVLDMARHYGSEYGFTVGGGPWVNGLGTLVRQLRGSGIQVVVLGATPKPPGTVPDCLSQHLDDVPACTAPRPIAVEPGTRAAERSAVQAAGGLYVDVAPWLCTDQRCAVILGNLLLFRDDNHLTTSFTRWLTPVLTDVVQAGLTQPS